MLFYPFRVRMRLWHELWQHQWQKGVRERTGKEGQQVKVPRKRMTSWPEPLQPVCHHHSSNDLIAAAAPWSLVPSASKAKLVWMGYI